MSVTMHIELKFETQTDAERVYGSVVPDNMPLPNGLRIESNLEGHTVYFNIRCERGLESLMATVEDLLGAIDLSLRTSASTG